MKRPLAGVAFALALALTPSAWAEKPQEQCISAYEEAQRLTLDGKLLAAREQLIVCARESCPKIAQADCSKWLTALDLRIPTVVVIARDASGRDVENVRVVVDGNVLADRLDGRPMMLDPGAHSLRFESDGKILEERVVIVESEKNRRLLADYSKLAQPAPAPPPAGPEREHGKVPVASWVLGGVSVLALGSFTVFALGGKSGEDCAPTCTRDQVDSFRRDFLVADISLGVALVAAGAALYFVLTNKPAASVAR